MTRCEFINRSVLQSLLDLDFSIFRVWLHSVFADTTVEITNCKQCALAYLVYVMQKCFNYNTVNIREFDRQHIERSRRTVFVYQTFL